MNLKPAIAGAMLVFLSPLAAYAQSQAGGLPALSNQVTLLEAAAASLQATLAAETVARHAADVALQNAINNLQTNITSAVTVEAGARQAADTALQTAINDQAAKIAAQASLIVTLQNQLAEKNDSLYAGTGGRVELDNNAPKIVASVNVPAGNYFVSAIVPVFNGDGSDQSGQCALSTGPMLETGFFNNFATAYLRLEGAGTDTFNTGQLPLVGSASFASNATITVSCTGYKWEINHAAVMAHGVGSLQ